MKLLKLLVVAGVFCGSFAHANEQDSYQTPSKALADLVDAKLAPTTRLSPDNQWMAFLERQRIATLQELAKPELKLAGIKLNPKNFSRARPRSKYLSITFKHLENGQNFTVKGTYNI